MRARFFYGWGMEVHFKDRLENGENPVTDIQRDRIEEHLRRMDARRGFYQIDRDDISTLVLLQEYKHKDEGIYEEWCPHCGGCTLYDETTGSVMCMWCGEDLLPCSMCREYGDSNGKCNFNVEPHSCRMYKGMNRIPAFCTTWDRGTEKLKMDLLSESNKTH